ncbi:hypothetical protein [Zobellella maritima]|uniref:hypothetical protein n=1 Tax=Zobellella maritima TaxID=2059725 RepID=UPI0013007A06|nr:hypothetical protein [Zobellella maritima]
MKNLALLMAAAISTSACSGLNLPMFTSIPPNTPGVSTALSDKTGQRVIDTISFSSANTFAKEPITDCVNGHISPPATARPDTEPRLIQFAGNDRIMATGSSPFTYRQYGVIPFRNILDFNLSVAARPGGTSYRFRDVIQIHQGTASPIRLYDKGNQQVYNSLQSLFRELDACTADRRHPRKTA